jgi:hypothetical protein
MRRPPGPTLIISLPGSTAAPRISPTQRYCADGITQLSTATGWPAHSPTAACSGTCDPAPTTLAARKPDLTVIDHPARTDPHPCALRAGATPADPQRPTPQDEADPATRRRQGYGGREAACLLLDRIPSVWGTDAPSALEPPAFRLAIGAAGRISGVRMLPGPGPLPCLTKWQRRSTVPCSIRLHSTRSIPSPHDGRRARRRGHCGGQPHRRCGTAGTAPLGSPWCPANRR